MEQSLEAMEQTCESLKKVLILNKKLNYLPTLIRTDISLKTMTPLIQHIVVSGDKMFLLSRQAGNCRRAGKLPCNALQGLKLHAKGSTILLKRQN